MNNRIKILNQTSRTAVIEVPGEDRYETAPYEIWLNGSFLRTEEKMVTILEGLLPADVYHVELKREDWSEMSIELETAPEFVTLNVRSFGAKGDGQTDDTIAIQTAILSCPPQGRVYVPAGTYRIRNLFLKSHLVLELGANAILQAFQEREEYPILPGLIRSSDETDEYNLGTWEGNPLDAMVSLLNGIYVEDVIICGSGTIDGGGDFEKWWVGEGNKGLPARPRMIFLNHCKDIVIQGITVRNSPSWNIHPYFSENIGIYGIRLESPANSHNTDGINPESCTNVEIAGVYFSVGDDCIAIKSGKIYMGKKFKKPCERISIRQCLMEKGHGAVTVGSEIAGGVRDLSVRSCVFRETDRGLRIKTRRGRGKDSIIDGIYFCNIYMDQVKSPIVVNSFYFCGPDGKSEYVGSQEAYPVDERTPEIRTLEFEAITCVNAHHTGISIYGLPEKKVCRVRLKNVSIAFSPQAQSGISVMMSKCRPSCAQGIYAQNVEELILDHVSFEGALQENEYKEIDRKIY